MFDIISDVGRVVGILFLAVFIPYFIVNLRRKTGSHIVLWTCVVVGIILIAVCFSGINRLILTIAGYITGPILSAISLKYGRNGWTRLRRKCLVYAGVVWRYKVRQSPPHSSLTFTWEFKKPKKHRIRILPRVVVHTHR